MESIHLYVFPHSVFPEDVKEDVVGFRRIIAEGFEIPKEDRGKGMPVPYLNFLTDLKEQGRDVVFVDSDEHFEYPFNKTVEEIAQSKFARIEVWKAKKIKESIQGGEAILCGEIVYESLRVFLDGSWNRCSLEFYQPILQIQEFKKGVKLASLYELGRTQCTSP